MYKALISIPVLIIVVWAAKSIAFQLASALWWVGIAVIMLAGGYYVLKVAREQNKNDE